jgi:hypothetical protein
MSAEKKQLKNETKVVPLGYPFDFNGERIDKLVLHPLQTRDVLDFKTQTTPERDTKEWVAPIAASARVAEALILLLDYRDLLNLAGEVSDYMVPFQPTSKTI